MGKNVTRAPGPEADTWLGRVRERWLGDQQASPNAAHPEELPTQPPLEGDFETLREILLHGPAAEQVRAATALSSHGPAAVEPLIAALENRDQAVRQAAATALGEIGDERAVQPLMQTLRSCFGGRSGQTHRLIGLAGALGLAVLFIGLFTGVMAAKMFGLISTLVMVSRSAVQGYVKATRSRGPLVHAIVTALSRIAERSPTPELRAAVSDLHAVAADTVQQDRPTREASREAAAKIDALTESIKNLPLIATAPEQGTSELPVPAHAAEPRPEELPRVRT